MQSAVHMNEADALPSGPAVPAASAQVYPTASELQFDALATPVALLLIAVAMYNASVLFRRHVQSRNPVRVRSWFRALSQPKGMGATTSSRSKAESHEALSRALEDEGNVDALVLAESVMQAAKEAKKARASKGLATAVLSSAQRADVSGVSLAIGRSKSTSSAGARSNRPDKQNRPRASLRRTFAKLEDMADEGDDDDEGGIDLAQVGASVVIGGRSVNVI